MSASVEERAAAMYDAGASITDVVRAFNLSSWWSARKMLAAQGCVIRGKDSHKGHPRRKPHGPLCKRCEVLLAEAPPGAEAPDGDGEWCGWCVEEMHLEGVRAGT